MNVDVLIVGAGFGGMCAGAQLREAGHTDFVILEKDAGLGGTWRANRYPGAACDVPSHLYSLSFARSSEWTRRFASQPEILAYMERCAERLGLQPHFRFGTEVVSATWNDAAARWTVTTRHGDVYEARFLIAATGGLSRPRLPDISGLDTFEGPMVHSARWDPDVRYDGARIGVIGTGASAVQIVPELAPVARSVTLFQRTPPWILPREDRAYRPWERTAFRTVPGLTWLVRMRQYWRMEMRGVAFLSDRPRLSRMVEGWCRAHIENQVPDPVLRQALTPTYNVGCKRVLLSDEYYPALCRDDVELVTHGIDRVDPSGLYTVDGRHHDFDVLVLCTGFRASDDMAPFPIQGRAGADLKSQWAAGGTAYLGTMVSGFPNLFVIVGPNTGLGHNSMIFMIECQVRYILSILDTLRTRGSRSVDVKAEAQDAFQGWLTERMGNTVWVRGGCNSWYLSPDGRNTTLWPAFTVDFERKTRLPDIADFDWERPSQTGR